MDRSDIEVKGEYGRLLPVDMRFITLQVLAVIAVIVFAIMLITTASYRGAGNEQPKHSGSALAESLWTAVPWLIMAACAFPAVRRIVAGS